VLLEGDPLIIHDSRFYLLVAPQFVEQLDITENSLFFGKKSMRFKSGDPLDIFYTKRQF
jgi:hypothetical protein